MQRHQQIAVFLLRLATGINFLSPVAGRLGLWGEKGGDWQSFLAYAAQVNSFAPALIQPALAIIATTLEVVIAILLIIGYKTKWAALAAALLTLTFALAMTYSLGIKDVLDYALLVDASSAYLLFTIPAYRWSLDEALKSKA